MKDQGEVVTGVVDHQAISLQVEEQNTSDLVLTA